jgi:hypothetical protein
MGAHLADGLERDALVDVVRPQRIPQRHVRAGVPQAHAVLEVKADSGVAGTREVGLKVAQVREPALPNLQWAALTGWS